MKKTLPLGDLVRAKEFQVRKIDPEYVEELSEAYGRKDEIPPPVVWTIKSRAGYHVTRGFHRIAGAEKADLRRLEVEVKSGTAEDAFLDALSGDRGNGKRFTNKEKRDAVKKAIKAYPEWTGRKIADALGVSPNFVAELRVSSDDTASTKAKKKQDALANLRKTLLAVSREVPTPQTADDWLQSVKDAAKKVAEYVKTPEGLF